MANHPQHMSAHEQFPKLNKLGHDTPFNDSIPEAFQILRNSDKPDTRGGRSDTTPLHDRWVEGLGDPPETLEELLRKEAEREKGIF